MKNILICTDKFKGSLTASQACEAIAAGLSQQFPAFEVMTHPLADGGDGMLEILQKNLVLKPITMEVCDPLFRPVTASYGLSDDGKTAFIEMSRASGLLLLSDAERNCLETTTYGTGELIRDALQRGATHIVLGMGGSATNDAAIGAAQALGYKFLDASGKQLKPIGKNLPLITHIDISQVTPLLRGLRLQLASDVQNVFYGKQGAAWTFARQKGADTNAIELLDDGLQNFARVIQNNFSMDIQAIAGAGAAGGLGGGLLALCDVNRIHTGIAATQLVSGIELVMDITGLEEKIATADMVITGEGKLDSQTLEGKVIDGVLQVAKKYGKPVAVLCGASSLSNAEIEACGITYCDTVLTDEMALDEAIKDAAQLLQIRARTLAADFF